MLITIHKQTTDINMKNRQENKRNLMNNKELLKDIMQNPSNNL